MTLKTSHTWAIFSLCLIAVAGALLWLSFHIVGLDRLRENDRRETETARQEAELQERISTALYRMDLRLIPLIATETARPREYYRSAVGDGNDLPPTSEFVRLHFEINGFNRFVSPQLSSIPPMNAAFDSQQQLTAVNKDMGSDDWETELESARALFRFARFDQQLGAQSLASGEIPATNVVQQPATFNNGYMVPAVDRAAAQIKQSQQATPDTQQSEQANNGKLFAQQARGKERLNEDFDRRRVATRNFATQSNTLNQRYPSAESDRIATVGSSNPSALGVMQPMWIKDRLLLVRRVVEAGSVLYQCCWLDWPQVQSALREEVADLLPEVEFQPLALDDELPVGMALTALPVRLEIDRDRMRQQVLLGGVGLAEGSGIWLPLLMAWLGFSLATLAAVVLLRGVIALSEQRASFVSAVTHELRTPLTTFRMYAEMLAEEMVPPEKQQQYANTLRLQADRLSHLVDNVLQFARLERNPGTVTYESVNVNEMVQRFKSRLRDRVAEADLRFNVVGLDSITIRSIDTQPAVVEQLLFNLVDNACKYGKPSRTGEVDLVISEAGGKTRFTVRDGGPGIPLANRRNIFRPFHKSDQDAANNGPGVGLGLALCQRMAKALGGQLSYQPLDAGASFVLEVPNGKR